MVDFVTRWLNQSEFDYIDIVHGLTEITVRIINVQPSMNIVSDLEITLDFG